MQSLSDYRWQARQDLQGRWGEAVCATLVVALVAMVCLGPSMPNIILNATAHHGGLPPYTWWSNSLYGLGFILALFICTPLQYAIDCAFLRFTRRNEGSVLSNTWSIFRTDYSSYLLAGLLISVLTGLLSVVTLGIGGIILAYAYRMVPYLLHDYPDLSLREVLRTSRQMMRGYKWRLFLLDLVFFGWYLLGIFTFFIAYFWIDAYQSTTMAHFYEDLKANRIVDEDASEDSQEAEYVEVEEA